jgi:hypothetical protein
MLAIWLACLCCSTAAAQIASGGAFKLNRAVIANGGGQSTDAVNNRYRINGTAGQSAAGYGLTTPRFGLISGFWNMVNAPTAASASISGRIVSPNGAGIRNVSVSLEGGSLTTPRTALSSSFGYFSLDDIEPGRIYVITITSKRFGFANPTQAVAVFGNVTDLVFQASWEN